MLVLSETYKAGHMHVHCCKATHRCRLQCAVCQHTYLTRRALLAGQRHLLAQGFQCGRYCTYSRKGFQVRDHSTSSTHDTHL